jgi:3-hydroxyacyl-CoA dehydrogenase
MDTKEEEVEIKKLCVLGAGLMGNGIAQICAQAGYEVFMRDIEQRFIDGGMNTIRKNLNRDAEKGKITEESLPGTRGNCSQTLLVFYQYFRAQHHRNGRYYQKA